MSVKVYTDNIPTEVISKWSSFAESHSENSIFQSPDIYEFYKEIRNYFPFAFISFDDDNNIMGILLAVVLRENAGILSYFSSRAIISGGPLIGSECEKKDVLDKLLSKLVVVLKGKTMYIQFRNFFEWTDGELQVFFNHGFSFSKRQNLLIDTTDKEKLISGISKSKLRQIDEARKNGSVIRTVASISELKEFYKLLKHLYNKKIRKPLADWSFFETFYKMSLNGKLGIIQLVFKDERVIGGAVAPITKSKSIFEWYIVGLDKEYKNNYPSVLATWSLINYALNNDIKCFDLMGLGEPEKDYGVRDFKLRFGGDSVYFGRLERINNKTLYVIIRQLYFLLFKIKALF